MVYLTETVFEREIRVPGPPQPMVLDTWSSVCCIWRYLGRHARTYGYPARNQNVNILVWLHVMRM